MLKIRKKKKKNAFFKHLKSVGFTNRLSIYILLFLLLGLIGGFYLAIRSIETGYTGALYCWTIVFTPLGTAVSIALSKIVDKSKAENTAGGIKYETALNGIEQPVEPEFEEEIIYEECIDSPQI